VLEWLARWPELPPDESELPRAMDAVAFGDRPAGPAIEALKQLRDRGAAARAWLVGSQEAIEGVPVAHAGLEWPLPE
jgi:hypothetical protein